MSRAVKLRLVIIGLLFLLAAYVDGTTAGLMVVAGGGIPRGRLRGITLPDTYNPDPDRYTPNTGRFTGTTTYRCSGCGVYVFPDPDTPTDPLDHHYCDTEGAF